MKAAPLIGMTPIALLVATVAVFATACRNAPCCDTTIASTPRVVTDEKQVLIELSVVRIPEEDAERVLGAYGPTSVTEPALLTHEEVEAILAAWRDDPSARIIQSPKILAVDKQDATIFVGETVHFAKSEVSQTEHGSSFAINEDPLSPIHLGFSVRVTPVVSADGSRIAVSIRESWREAKAGFAPEEITRGGAAKFVSDYSWGRSFDVALDLPIDGAALLGDPTAIEDNEGRHVRLTVLTVRVIKPTRMASQPRSLRAHVAYPRR